MPSGVSFPGLAKKIEWRDHADRSEATVQTPSSGVVQLMVVRDRAGWRATAYGWLGVQLFRAGHRSTARGKAKTICLTWWGKMTAADRLPLPAE